MELLFNPTNSISYTTRLRSKVFSLVRPCVKVKPSTGATISDPKIFQTQNIFESNISSDPELVLIHNFFVHKILTDPEFFRPKFISGLWVNKLSDRKFFQTKKNFFDPKFFILKLFQT